MITKEQHGFIQRKSVCGNLLESLCDWEVNLESRLITDVVYIDFKKAFDSVSHTKLLLKDLDLERSPQTPDAGYHVDESFKHTGYVETY